METGYIKEFVVLAECLNFSEAANLCFVSQSTLSKHIKTLEKDLDTDLFARTTRSIRLTEAGTKFYQYATEIRKLCDEARLSIEDLQNEAKHSFILAAMTNPQYYNLEKYVVSFQNEHPEIRFQIVEGDEHAVFELYRSHKANIFPTYENFDSRGEEFQFFPITRSYFQAVLRKTHPLAERQTLSLLDLKEERLLFPGRNTTLHRTISKAFSDADISPEVVYEGYSTGCIGLAKAGMGIAIIPNDVVRTIAGDEDLVNIPIEPMVTFAYGIGHRDVKSLSRAEQIFLTHMKKFEWKE